MPGIQSAMETSFIDLVLIPIVFFTSCLAAIIGMGGGILLIALMPGLVPAAAIIPIHAATQLASNVSRAAFGWRDIDRGIIPAFTVGALAGAWLGGGSLKGALGGGGMALLASLAMQAFKNADRTPAGVQGLAANELPLGMRVPANATEEQELESTAELVLRGMLNAAKADGKIDAAEGEKLTARLQDAGLDRQEQQHFMDELRRPLDLDDFVASIPNEAVAAQVYAASLFAIKVDTQAERDYLAQLAQRSGLDDGVVKQLHMAVGLG